KLAPRPAPADPEFESLVALDLEPEIAMEEQPRPAIRLERDRRRPAMHGRPRSEVPHPPAPIREPVPERVVVDRERCGGSRRGKRHAKGTRESGRGSHAHLTMSLAEVGGSVLTIIERGLFAATNGRI